MKIHIIIVSDKIEKYYIDAIAEYQKRLSRYCKIQYSTYKTVEQLTKKIPSNSYIINLTSQGNTMSSEDLALKINDYGIRGNSNIVITNASVLNHTDETWCLSKMSMSPALTTTILYEQIYRAYRIINNQPYHK